ncbi:hypothetical protein [Microbacterium sp. zg.B96]
MLTVIGFAGASFGVLTACATAASPGAGPGTPPASFGAVWPQPPAGDVVGTGTVIDVGGEAELCLGPVMESFPPACAGVALAGWSWADLDGVESAGDVTWGVYAVRGDYDGEALTVTDTPILLALYDPIRGDDPADGVAGTTDAAQLEQVQAEIVERLGADLLGTYLDRGYVWAQVVWDDGTLQDAADAEFGDDVVIVESALRDFDD